MKIAILGVALNCVSGGTRRLIELTRRLEERGYDVVLYTVPLKASKGWRGLKFPSKIETYGHIDDPIEADYIFNSHMVAKQHFNNAKGRKVFMLQNWQPDYEPWLKDPSIIKLCFNSWHADWLQRKFGQKAVRAIGGVDPWFFNPPGPHIGYNELGRAKVILAQQDRLDCKNYRLVQLAFKNIKSNGFKLEPLIAKDQYELREKYRKALFFVTAESSPQYCWSNPAAEAMACGCPVIVVDHPATKDHCLHERTAEVVSPRVPSISAALSEAMHKLIENPGYRARLAETAYRYIHNFSYEKVLDVVEQKILKATPQPLKITFFPTSNVNTGGSRGRCYQIGDALRKMGHNIAFEDPSGTEVAIFEKRFDRKLAERLKAKGAKIVLDCCDPYWMRPEPTRSQLLDFMEIADHITVSSKRLAKWWTRKKKRVKVLADSFDWKSVPKVKKESEFTICWHGTSFTVNWGTLDVLIEPLNRLKKQFDFDFKIIVELVGNPRIPKFDFEPVIVDWNLETYLAEIAKCHVGVNPLLKDEWCMYKSYGKPISYMGLGLPAVVTSIPSYQEILENGKNAFLIKDNDPDEWYKALKTLIVDKKKRSSMVKEGRKLAQDFSVERVAEKYDQFLRSILGGISHAPVN